MIIDKGRLAMNLIIFAIVTAVCTAFVRIAIPSASEDLGALIITGLTFAIMFYIPVRMFPQVGLIGSIIILVVEWVLFVMVATLLGETIGSVVALILLLAAFIASLIFL